MQDDQAKDWQDQGGLFARWRARLSQALLREPAVVLLERDADAPFYGREEAATLPAVCEPAT